MPSIVSFHRNVGHAVILIILFSFFTWLPLFVDLSTYFPRPLIGMCMGSGALFSYYFGKREEQKMKDRIRLSFLVIGGVTILLNVLVMAFRRPILRLLQVPDSLMEMMHTYVWIIFTGIFFVFLYPIYPTQFDIRQTGFDKIPLLLCGIRHKIISAEFFIFIDIFPAKTYNPIFNT